MVPNVFAQKLGEMGQKKAKNRGVFNLKKNLVINFHWIYSIMKIFVIYCVHAQILHLRKILFLRYRRKCSQPIRLQDFKWTISPEKINETASVLACWYKCTKIKGWLKLFWSGMVKNGYGQSGLWSLKLMASLKWTNGINWFFACWYNFMQIKRWLKVLGVGMVKNGCG